MPVRLPTPPAVIAAIQAAPASETNAQVAARLGCSKETAKKYRRQVKDQIQQIVVAECAEALASVDVPVQRGLPSIREHLTANVVRLERLIRACEEWLEDPDDAEVYLIGPRSDEVDVIYQVEVRTPQGFRVARRKRPLSDLLGLLDGLGEDPDGARFLKTTKAEYKHADPRELIVRVLGESRQTYALLISALAKLLEAQWLYEERQVMVEEIGKESPDCARRIAERLQRRIALFQSVAGAESVCPAPAAAAEPV